MPRKFNCYIFRQSLAELCYCVLFTLNSSKFLIFSMQVACGKYFTYHVIPQEHTPHTGGGVA